MKLCSAGGSAQACADQLPTVNAGINGSRGPAANGAVTSSYTAGLSVTAYELDFFGRVNNLSEAAAASLLATALMTACGGGGSDTPAAGSNANNNGGGNPPAAVTCNTAFFQAGTVAAPTSAELAAYAATYSGDEGAYGPNPGDAFVKSGSATFVLGADGASGFRTRTAATMPRFNALARTLYDNWRRVAFKA